MHTFQINGLIRFLMSVTYSEPVSSVAGGRLCIHLLDCLHKCNINTLYNKCLYKLPS